LRKEKTRDSQGTAGHPDEADGNPGGEFAHSRSQRMNDGDISLLLFIQCKQIMRKRFHYHLMDNTTVQWFDGAN